MTRASAERLIARFCNRVPRHVLAEYRLEYGVRGNSITLYECRAPWHPRLEKWTKHPSAQFRFDMDGGLWTLYWADRNSRWHVYDDINPSPDLSQLLAEVDADPTGIFFG